MQRQPDALVVALPTPFVYEVDALSQKEFLNGTSARLLTILPIFFRVRCTNYQENANSIVTSVNVADAL